ncbi:hypothetical protein [Rossellomorea marisflavi]|uniref:hypothetical protein n=1 Tax=Rossellomorea marisflavi TaxID=189381 RepID=UPI003FA099A1
MFSILVVLLGTLLPLGLAGRRHLKFYKLRKKVPTKLKPLLMRRFKVDLWAIASILNSSFFLIYLEKSPKEPVILLFALFAVASLVFDVIEEMMLWNPSSIQSVFKKEEIGKMMDIDKHYSTSLKPSNGKVYYSTHHCIKGMSIDELLLQAIPEGRLEEFLLLKASLIEFNRYQSKRYENGINKYEAKHQEELAFEIKEGLYQLQRIAKLIELPVQNESVILEIENKQDPVLEDIHEMLEDTDLSLESRMELTQLQKEIEQKLETEKFERLRQLKEDKVAVLLTAGRNHHSLR